MAAPAFVQAASNAGAGVDDITCTFGSNMTEGNQIVAFIAYRNDRTLNTATMAGWTWSDVSDLQGDAPLDLRLTTATVPASPGATLTWTNCLDSTGYFNVIAFEVSGFGSVDKYALEDWTTSVESAAIGPTGNTTEADELALAFIAFNNTTPSAPDWSTNSFTARVEHTSTYDTYGASKTLTSTGAVTATVTWTGSAEPTGGVVTLAPPAAGEQIDLEAAVRARSGQDTAWTGTLTALLEAAERVRAGQDVTARILTWAALEAAVRVRSGQDVTLTPGAATAALDAGHRTRSAQDTGWTGTLTVGLDPAERTRTALDTGWSGLLAAALEAAERIRAAQDTVFTPGGTVIDLDAALRERFGEDVSFTPGAATAALEAALRERAAGGVTFSGSLTVPLDPAHRTRTGHDLTAQWGAVVAALEAAVRARTAQTVTPTFGAVTIPLAAARRVRTAIQVLVYMLVRELTRKVQIARSVDLHAYIDRGLIRSVYTDLAEGFDTQVDRAVTRKAHVERAVTVRLER